MLPPNRRLIQDHPMSSRSVKPLPRTAWIFLADGKHYPCIIHAWGENRATVEREDGQLEYCCVEDLRFRLPADTVFDEDKAILG